MKNYKKFVEAKIPEKPKEYRKPTSFKDALKGILDGSVEPEEMKNFIGLDPNKYEIADMNSWSKESSLTEYGMGIHINSDYFSRLINVEDWIPTWILHIINPYSGYEFDAYGEEEYFGGYLNDKGIEHVKTLAKKYGFDLKTESEYNELDVNGLFEYLGLERLKDDLIDGIREIKEDCVIKTAKEVLKSLPFGMDFYYKNGFNLDITFSWEEVNKYIEKIDNVDSLKDFLDNIDTDDLCSDVIEWSPENEDTEEWKRLEFNIEQELETLVENPDDVIPYIITTDNLDLFKKFMDDANFYTTYEGYKYGVWTNDKRRLTLFELVKSRHAGKIEEFFKSIEFQKPFMEKYFMEEKDKYFLLKNAGIMHPEIKDEWGWIEESEKFNF